MPSPRSNTLSQAEAAADRRQAALWLLCGLILCAALCGPLVMGRVPISDDLGAFHLPLRRFYAQCLSRGDAFDWCPQLFAGFYLTGEGQVGTYHPVHWLLYRSFELPTAFNLELLLSYPLMMAGMYLFLSRHVARRSAAMFGALIWTFCGFNTLHFVHPHAVAILAHVPWLLWCCQLACQYSGQPRGALSLAGVSLLTASQILLGYPQNVWFSLLTMLAYLGFLWTTRQAPPRLFVHVAAALMLGLLAGAVQLLPTWDWLSDSRREQVDSDFAFTGSLHPLNLVQLIGPYLFATRVAGDNTHELGLYMGVAPLMLLAWHLTRGPTTSEDRFFRFALWLTVVCFVLALGSGGGLYLFQTWLPVIGKFRMPARYLAVVHFGLAIMAAVAMARLLEAPRGTAPDRQPARAMGKVVLVSAVLAALAPFVWERAFIASAGWRWIGPALLAAAAAALLLCLRQTRGAYVLLAVLTTCDLGYYGLSYAVYPNGMRLTDYLSAGAPPTCHKGYRIAAESPATEFRAGNHLMVRGYSQVDGYAGLEPHKLLDYRQQSALQLAGVEWVSDQQSSGWRRIPDPLPRIRLVGMVQRSSNPRDDVERIDLRTTALIDREIAIDGTADGEARVVEERPGMLRIVIEGSARQLLVIADSYHAGWRAQMDGRPAELIRVNGDFMGCVVDAGSHEVRLSFQPASLVWGRRLSLLGLTAIGGSCALALFLSQKKQESWHTTERLSLEQELAHTI